MPGEAKTHLRQYVIAMGYGKEHYTTEDIQQMFSTLDALRGLWPHNAKTKMIKCRARWRRDSTTAAKRFIKFRQSL